MIKPKPTILNDKNNELPTEENNILIKFKILFQKLSRKPEQQE